jgi:hypothetical protein
LCVTANKVAGTPYRCIPSKKAEEISHIQKVWRLMAIRKYDKDVPVLLMTMFTLKIKQRYLTRESLQTLALLRIFPD